MLVLSFLRDFIDLWNPKFCKTEYLVSLNLATSSQIPKPRIRPNRYNVQHGDYSEQHGDYSEQYYIVYLKAAKKIDLKSSHHGKKKIVIIWGVPAHQLQWGRWPHCLPHVLSFQLRVFDHALKKTQFTTLNMPNI